MKRFLSLFLTIILLLSFTGCEKKSEYVEFGDLWGSAVSAPSNLIVFLETDGVTEYIAEVDKGSFSSRKTINALPGEEYEWFYHGGNGQDFTDYIRITAKSNSTIVGYAIVKIRVYREGYSRIWEPSVVKSVSFSNTKIRKGITQEYVDGLMNEIIEREERK